MDKTSIGALGAQCESLLMARVFEPFAKALGEMGEGVVSACTMSLAAQNDGFGAAVSAQLEKNGRAGR